MLIVEQLEQQQVEETRKQRENSADSMLRATADVYMRKIICSTISKGKSIEELSHESDIPMSSCYRRVHELLALRLLRIERTIITPNGKKYETYQSVVRGVVITLKDNELSVEVEANPKANKGKLFDVWAMDEESGTSAPDFLERYQ